MNPRIVFVDDDPMILSSIQRQIMMKLPDVELVLCNSGQQALDLLEEISPAIVFSDVRMPNKNGSEFLAKVAELYPCCVRFALTGHSEADQLEKVFPVAHQVLSKPMASARLVKLISTTLLFQSTLKGLPIESHLIRILEGHCSYSRLSEALSMIRSNDTSLNRIADFFEQDLILKVRLLGVANSDFVSSLRPVTSVAEAIAKLGLLAVDAIYSADLMKAELGDEHLLREEVRRSIDFGNKLKIKLQNAIHTVSLPKELHEHAFTAATYYPFGRIQFASLGGKEYSDLRNALSGNSIELVRQEKERFGASQELAGAYKLFLWGFAEDSCLAIANLTETSTSSAKIREALDIALREISDSGDIAG